MNLDDPLLWQSDPWLRGLNERIGRTPRPFRMVTFDFFDTMVHRLVAQPSDLFVEVGRRIAARGLFKRAVTAEGFHDVRIAADERARKEAIRRGRALEIHLADIYREMKGLVTDVDQALAIEWEAELDACWLNPSMASLVRYLRSMGYSTAVVSDTYFSARQLEGILLRNGFNPRHFDRIWASCEQGCAKYDSSLFRLVLRDTRLHGNDVLHIGDNPVADVQGAITAGIEPVEYHPTLNMHQAILKAEGQLRLERHPVAGSLDSVRVLASRLDGGTALDGHFEGAMSFGPLLSRYADWAVEHYQRAGITTVLALMREGELLGELLTRAAAARQIELKVIPCYVSRKSTAVASLGEPTVDRMMELLLGGPDLAWQDVLEILGLGDLGRMAPGITPELLNTKVNSPEALRWLLTSLLGNPDLASAINANVVANHGLAFDYLQGLVGDQAAVGLADLGWSGSIQKNMTEILRRGGRNVRFVGCYLANTRRAARLWLDGGETHAFLTQDWNFKSLLLEIAITATVGSTEGYRRGKEGQVEPVLGPFEATEEERLVKQRVKEGILLFQDLWLKIISQRRGQGLEGLLEDIDGRLYAVAVRMLHYPTEEAARTLGILRHDENYGVLSRQALVDRGAIDAFHAGGTDALLRRPECHWPQGVLARANPRLMHLLALRWGIAAPTGRLGARASTKGLDLGFGIDECHHLDRILANVDIGQVWLVGRGSVGDTLWLNNWLEGRFGVVSQPEGDGPLEIELPEPGDPSPEPDLEARPRAVYLDAEAPAGPVLELVPRLVRCGTRFLTAGGVARLRRLLRLGEPCLLVFGEGTCDDRSLAILRGLTPFLAPGSIVGFCHGGADVSQKFGPDPALDVFRLWMASGAIPDGYEVVDDLLGDRTFGTSILLANRNQPHA